MTDQDVPLPEPRPAVPFTVDEPLVFRDEERLDRVVFPVATVLLGLVIVILTIALVGS